MNATDATREWVRAAAMPFTVNIVFRAVCRKLGGRGVSRSAVRSAVLAEFRAGRFTRQHRTGVRGEEFIYCPVAK